MKRETLNYQLPYEKQITSQHGEDGIMEKMFDAIKVPRDYTFFEIGWGEGDTNMTRWLMDEGWQGVAVDPHTPKIMPTKKVKHFQELVYPNTCNKYLSHLPLDCDFFSLDIDSFDFYVAKELLKKGFRPKTVCVEVNKNFGSTSIASFPYIPESGKIYHKLFFNGVSIAKYKKLFSHYGYEFFTVDTSIVNAMFYRKDACDKSLHELPKLDKDYVGEKDSVKEWFDTKQAPKERLQNLMKFWGDKTNLIWNDKDIL